MSHGYLGGKGLPCQGESDSVSFPQKKDEPLSVDALLQETRKLPELCNRKSWNERMLAVKTLPPNDRGGVLET